MGGIQFEAHVFKAPAGYRAVGLACGIKESGAKDLALIVSDREASAAGVFTTNRVHAAPVRLNRAHLKSGTARAIIVNSGNANACTGEPGEQDAALTAQELGKSLSLPAEDVLVNSTGVIGVPLPMDTLLKGAQDAVRRLGETGWSDAAEAIMTTDTRPKTASATFEVGGTTVTISGMAKGAGMIAPNMATMLGFIVTDAALPPSELQSQLSRSVKTSFNCITVDGDMSTNDTVLALANGASGIEHLSGADLDTFSAALDQVCTGLARQIARDGEGATKLIKIHVRGAPDEAAARTVGLSVANSNLVKTAIFGRDPNWGRILCAAGYAGVDFDPDRTTVSIVNMPIYASGRGVPFDHDAAVEALGAEEIPIDIDLGSGDGEATIYTCDLTYDYVRINAEYTT
jgi:glutamate N-acetyltransferase/amino-acid N-acetyltransferase